MTSSAAGEELVEQLIRLRTETRRDKNFKRADAIRRSLLDAGILLEDRPTGTTWSRTT